MVTQKKRVKDEKRSFLIETESLGKGQFGEVFKGCDEHNREKIYAFKVISKEIFKKAQMSDKGKTLERELEIMKEIDHPNIVKHHETMETGSNYYLVLVFCPNVI